ncbi:hypothetical protein MMC31_000945 [Peltigera leucophlebia]|nr:hypothetical protein [Peltigera leucophlebia]
MQIEDLVATKHLTSTVTQGKQVTLSLRTRPSKAINQGRASPIEQSSLVATSRKERCKTKRPSRSGHQKETIEQCPLRSKIIEAIEQQPSRSEVIKATEHRPLRSDVIETTEQRPSRSEAIEATEQRPSRSEVIEVIEYGHREAAVEEREMRTKTIEQRSSRSDR